MRAGLVMLLWAVPAKCCASPTRALPRSARCSRQWPWARWSIGFRLPGAIRADVDTLVLDRVQDAGNVGSLLRSAAALGVAQVLALPGTAALWSPKVLRAGMGAHLRCGCSKAWTKARSPRWRCRW